MAFFAFLIGRNENMITALLILMGVLTILTLFIFLNMASIAEEYEEGQRGNKWIIEYMLIIENLVGNI